MASKEAHDWCEAHLAHGFEFVFDAGREPLLAELARWKKAIEGLTPSGSEFVSDPEACAAHIRKQCQYPKMIVDLREENRKMREAIEGLRGLPDKLHEIGAALHSTNAFRGREIIAASNILTDALFHPTPAPDSTASPIRIFPCYGIAPQDGEPCALPVGHEGPHSAIGLFRNKREPIVAPGSGEREKE